MSDLLNIIASNIPQLSKDYSHIQVFQRTKNLHLFFGAFLILFICLAAYCLNRGTFIPGVIFVGGSFFILYAFIIEFIGVRIVDDNLTVIIVYPFWKKKISFSRIKELSLELSRAGNSKMSPFVILNLVNGKKIKLNGLRNGTIALFSALKNRIDEKSS